MISDVVKQFYGWAVVWSVSIWPWFYYAYYSSLNGMDIPVSFSGSVMSDKDDNVIGIVGIARDMREILRLQESEREFIVEKARSEALQERAQELQEAYDKLRAIQAQLIQSEKMAAVGQLAGGVAHEINNPMGVILGFAQSIVKRIKEDDPLYMPLKSIEREAVRCKKLVGDLLTFEIGKGTGLGLSLCYELIQRHNGTVAVESETGKGATFIIKLPESRGL